MLLESLIDANIGVTQLAITAEDGFYVAARKAPGDRIVIAAVDSTTSGHLNVYPVLPDNTRDWAKGVSGAQYDPTEQHWCVAVHSIDSDIVCHVCPVFC